MIRPTLLLVLAAGMSLGCNKEEAAPTPAAPQPTAPVVSAAAPAPAEAPSSDAGSAAATPAATTPPKEAPAAAKTFTHSKLGFGFSYPDVLTPKEEAKGVTLTSAPIAKMTVDRSDKAKGATDVSLVVRVTLEDGALVAVAKKTNANFGRSFPDGTPASFKEEADYSEKVTVGTATGYAFTMGSHGSNERVTFLPGNGNKTLVVRCSYVGDGQSPTMSEASQLEACAKIVSTLEP